MSDTQKTKTVMTDAAIEAMDHFAERWARGVIGGRNDYMNAFEKIVAAVARTETPPMMIYHGDGRSSVLSEEVIALVKAAELGKNTLLGISLHLENPFLAQDAAAKLRAALLPFRGV